MGDPCGVFSPYSGAIGELVFGALRDCGLVLDDVRLTLRVWHGRVLEVGLEFADRPGGRASHGSAAAACR